ncbi:MAG: hypothetical protein K6L80_14330 [Agarilytica sp.]
MNIVNRNRLRTAAVLMLSEILLIGSIQNPVYAESAGDYISVPPLINTSSSGDKPNVLFILDNSNSMDEAPSGQAVGSANSGSKSEIARNAIEDIIDNFGASSRMGLMAYKQSSISKRRLHDSQYDASFNPANYDADFTGDRASATKRYRVPNPANSGSYIYYNVALPFYSGSNYGSKFCYSTTASFDNGSESAGSGPWDRYACYTSKTGTSDGNSGLSGFWTNARFSPTDSDYAQNILDFGTNLTWQYVSETWFSNSSPGKGYLHVEIDDVDAGQVTLLKQKLATSQFSTSSDTPLRNAGLTPVEGSLRSASSYFSGTLSGSESSTGSTPSLPPANTCAQQDYVILVTDGLPSVDASGNLLTDTNAAIAQSAAEAANLLSQGVKTYVIGFALPTGVDSALLDTIANAGGTGTTYLANDSATLLSSLESIFLSFSNRDASSSSSAVLANNSRGEGAIFQAVYSPVKEDGLGNEVTWVGSLFGLFLDENGFIREDTNQNAQLDDYSTDRVAQYFFDTNLGKTQVNLYVGGVSTPPDFTVATPVATIDIDELATMWEARDQLNDVSDVLTQRAYASNASSGRYIISSVDGQNLVDFVQVSDAQIQSLVDLQTAAADILADADATLNVAQAQFNGAQAAVTDMVNQRDAAVALRDAAQVDVDSATAAHLAATATLTSAQSSLSSAQNDFDNLSQEYTDNYSSRYDGMIDSADVEYRGALSSLNSRSSQDEFDSLVTALINEGADVGDPLVIDALDDLNTAQNNVAASLSALQNEIDDYISGVSNGAASTGGLTDQLANTGTISDTDRSTVLNTMASLASNDYADFVTADGNYSINNLIAQRDAYVNALVATGVNTNRPAVRNAVEDYDDARALEAAAESGLHSSVTVDVLPGFDAFFGGQFDLIGGYDQVSAAQDDVDTAQSAVDVASQVLADAQTELDERAQDLVEAEADLTGAQALLTPVEDSYNTILSEYNAALAAYNQATATVNNSDTLINYLDVPTVEEAYNTVKFVRGEENLPGFRSRTIDYDGDGITEVWRLGDIVHSSPSLVGAPNDGYDSVYGDKTYAAYREQYKDRRNVLYVGSNGGMLHAFNAGFWDLENKAFKTSDSFAGGSATAHPLGAELWSYVPRAVLPHLQWMTNPNYGHSYYVDGDPITFDANIFSSDSVHPNGWGTVLMVGLRFGGADIDVDVDSDGVDDTTVSSSYVLFDVTNPEQPPTLIAELSDPGFGFTTSVPTVIKRRAKSTSFASPTSNEWYVAFGSGPTSLYDASSAQTSGLYIYDLVSKTYVSGFGPLALSGISFVGDVASFDDGNDYIDDTLYFGVTGGSPSSGSIGALYRTRLDQSAGSSTSVMINALEPILAAPAVVNDKLGRRRVSFGSGRLFMAPDNITTQPRHFYGVMEPVNSAGEPTWSEVSLSDLENVTDIEVRDTGLISYSSGAPVQIPSGTTVENFEKLITSIRDNRAGWTIDFVANGSDPSMRNISKGAVANNVLFFSSYQPSSSMCQPEGTSRLYGVDVRTGTAIPFEVFAPDDDPNSHENDVVDAYITLGQGLASAPKVIRNSDGVTVFTSKSTTEQINTDVRIGVYKTGRQSWRQISLD